MIIDLILNRKDEALYSPEQFYKDVFNYGEIGWDITRALDAGTENQVKQALCQYIDNQGYSEHIKDFVNSVNWL